MAAVVRAEIAWLRGIIDDLRTGVAGEQRGAPDRRGKRARIADRVARAASGSCRGSDRPCSWLALEFRWSGFQNSAVWNPQCERFSFACGEAQEPRSTVHRLLHATLCRMRPGATLDTQRGFCSNRGMDPTRRQVLHAVGAGVALACSGSARGERSKGDALDEALHRIHRREPDSVNGLSTHAPMVVEVLDALGRADRIEAWLDGYRGTTRQLPRATGRIDPARWRDALGPDVAASSWERANPRWADPQIQHLA